MRLFVANLPFAATEDQIKELFAEFGSVVSLRIIRDPETGLSRGFGFVEMEEAEACRAIRNLHGRRYAQRILTVTEAEDRHGQRGQSA